MSYLVPLGLAVALLCQSTLACAAWQCRTAAMNGVEGLGGTKQVLSRSLSFSPSSPVCFQFTSFPSYASVQRKLAALFFG